ncbi:MAG: cyclase family protein [Actinomycetota bacterium]
MTLPSEFTELAREVNNWGRWGDDDELGTLNLITPEVVVRAAECVKRGVSFALGLPLHADGPQTGVMPGRINPIHLMTQVNQAYGSDDGFHASDDAVVMGLQCATHWDAFSHVSYAERIYNGFGAESITSEGAKHGAIHAVRSLVSRGVLLDVARAKGVERLDPGYCVAGADLDAAAEFGRVKVESGDIVLIRTGHIQLLDAGDKRHYGYPSPGPGLDAVRWFRMHDVAAVANDTLTFEVMPGERDDLFLPVHLLDLVEMGLIQGQNFHLEALAEDCAGDSAYAFLLEATPEPFVGAVGAPVQPVAVK